jgi:hypothetical protein
VQKNRPVITLMAASNLNRAGKFIPVQINSARVNLQKRPFISGRKKMQPEPKPRLHGE